MGFKFLALLFLSTLAHAGFPPTTVKDSGDSTPVVTFNFQFPNFTGTHTSTTYSLGVNSIAGGGTGQTTANDALNALLPSQTGNSGKALVTDGTNTSWQSATLTGNANRLAWFDGGGNLTSLDPWSVNADSSINLQQSTPQAGDATLLNLSSNATVGGNAYGITTALDGATVGSATALDLRLSSTIGGNATAINIYEHSDSTTGSNIVNINSDGTSGNGRNVINGYNSGNITGDYRAAQFGNDGTVSGFSAGVLVNQGGNVTKGFTGFGSYFNANAGDGAENTIMFDAGTSSGKTINSGLFGFNFFNQASFLQGFNGVSINNQAPYTGDLNFFNGFNQGVMTGNNTLRGLSIFNSNTGTGYRFSGVDINNQASQTEEIRGFNFSSTGNSRTSTGFDINMTGNATDDARGLRVIVNNQTSSSTTQHVHSAEFSGGTFSVQSDYTPFSGATVDVGNNLTATATVQAGSPITGTDNIVQLIQSNLLVHDDIATGPIGIDTNMVAIVPQVAVDSGKTIPLLRSLLLGTTVPMGSGGTITDHVVLELLGLPSFGGSVTNVNRVMIQDSQLVGQNFCDGATNCWGIKVRDSNADNWFKKDVVIGGTTGKPSGTNSLDVTGSAQISKTLANDTAGGALTALVSSHTTVDGDITTIANQTSATATVDAGATNGKSLIGTVNTVTRGDGTDQGTLSELAGTQNLLFHNTDAAGVTNKVVGFENFTFSIAGTIDSLYDFKSTRVPAGPGVVTNHYGVYIDGDSSTPVKNFLSGSTLIGGSSFTTPTAELDVNGAARIRGLTTAGLVTTDASGNLSSVANSTSSVPEGSNLYFTDARARTAVTAAPLVGDVEIQDGHLLFDQTTPPTVAVQASAGTGATCALSSDSTDSSGEITIVTGTLGVSTGSYCKITFNEAFTIKPHCVVSPASSTLSTSVYVPSTTTDADMSFAVAGGLTSTYVINYFCPGNQ